MQGSYEPKVVSPQQCCQTRLKVLEPNQGYHGMRRRMLIRSNLVSGGYLFPGGRYPQKTTFFTYAGPFLGVLESNQWYPQTRNRILQQLQGIRRPTLKTGGSYGQKTCFPHICRAFPGAARDQPMVSADAHSNSATTSGG